MNFSNEEKKKKEKKNENRRTQLGVKELIHEWERARKSLIKTVCKEWLDSVCCSVHVNVEVSVKKKCEYKKRALIEAWIKEFLSSSKDVC